MAGQFVKGDTRINRSGRPKKGMALTDILASRLDGKDKDGVLLRQAVVDKLVEAALSGDIHALKYVIDRIDGKPKESVGLDLSTIGIAPQTIAELNRVFLGG